MRIAHLSDLHVSRYGIPLTGPPQQPVSGVHLIPQRDPKTQGWEPVYEEDGWALQLRPRGRLVRGERLRLIDPHGIVHSMLPFGNTDWARSRLLELMANRRSTAAAALAEDFPDRLRTERLLHKQPENVNLRLCALAWQIREHDPDVVVISGDLTDDGLGYDLILAAFAPWVASGRLLVVPGNHDIYADPPFLVPPSRRRSEKDKRKSWSAFVGALPQPEPPCVVPLDEVCFVLLDSAHAPRVPHSQSGAVPLAQLQGLADQLTDGVRILVLHHHVLNPPIEGKVPVQAGMKLRNASEVMSWAREQGITVILNGHRHVGYRFEQAGRPLILSAPSSTRGCKTGAPTTYWELTVEGGTVRGVTARAVSGAPASQGAGA